MTDVKATGADRSLLAQLHNLLAEDMLKRLKSGDLEAKDWTAIGKFLKDNGVDVMSADKSPEEDAFEALFAKAQESIINKEHYG